MDEELEIRTSSGLSCANHLSMNSITANTLTYFHSFMNRAQNKHRILLQHLNIPFVILKTCIQIVKLEVTANT